MRILVGIANFGIKNQRYVERLISTYRGFRHDVRIAVFSNVPKTFADDVDVHVGLPTENPWSLPFAHRAIFAERQDDYDLFIYSEDDTEVTERNVEAFLSANEVLPTDRIAGFLRYEKAPDGTQYCSTVHAHCHWAPESVLRIGDRIFAQYTNDHAACYMLTRLQLKRCIQSGGYLVAPHATRYDMLCSAATDPYTQCGFTKVICISHLDDFLLHHLPDIYLGRIGIERRELDMQIQRLLRIAGDDAACGPLLQLRAESRWPGPKKSYFEPYRPDAVELMPQGRRTLLSIGCERGLTEAHLLTRGYDVTAVPLDGVIAASAEMRGIKTTPPNIDCALGELADRRFDGLFFNNILPYVPDPVSLLRRFCSLLSEDGFVVASFDNLARLVPRNGRLWKGLSSRQTVLRRAAIDAPPSDAAVITSWLSAAGLVTDKVTYSVDGRRRPYASLSAGLADRWLAQTGAVRAYRGSSH